MTQPTGNLKSRQRQFLADKYTGMACLLNGRPAQIVGRLETFATVRTLGDGPSYQWAWETVGRVMESGGKFRS